MVLGSIGRPNCASELPRRNAARPFRVATRRRSARDGRLRVRARLAAPSLAEGRLEWVGRVHDQESVPEIGRQCRCE